MHSVTSNAVAKMFNTNLNDVNEVNITSLVTCLLGVDTVTARRQNNLVKLNISGTYTGSPTTTTQQLIKSMPEKYKPKSDYVGLFFASYNSTQGVSVARGMVASDGSVYIGETNWYNGTNIRIDVMYFVD